MKQRSYKSAYLTRQLARSHSVLADPLATDEQRHFARCRLNKAIRILGALCPVPAMKVGLMVDRLAENARRRAIA